MVLEPAFVGARVRAFTFSQIFSESAWSKPNVCEKVQVGNDQEKAQSEKDSHSKNRGGKKPN